MKTGILVTLLFAAVASTLLDVTLADDDDSGMCPHEYFRKHPEAFKEKMDLQKKYGMPNYNKLPSCSSSGTCEGNLKCCKTPCGLKCMEPLYEHNAMKTLDEMYKNIGQGPVKEPYEMTEADKKYGMCPETYLVTHPELQEKMRNPCKHKKSNPNEECTHEDCKRQRGKHHRQFRNLTNLADCSEDGDCADNMRCCNTLCGKKCVKPVFTNKDFMNSMFEEKPREKREIQPEYDEGRGECMGHGRGGKCQGRLGEDGKCQGRGGEHGKSKGKGGKRGKSKGKGGKGKGKGREQGQGDENGWGQGNGKGFGGQFEG